MRKNVILGISLGLAHLANAVVYIGDPSIDEYKQKTDQTFYDIYQNPDSALGGQVQSNPEAGNYFNSIPTGNHFVEGKYLERVKQSSVSGGSIPDGTTARLLIFGKAYTLEATANGLVLKDASGRVVSSLEELKIDEVNNVSDVEQKGYGRKAVFIPTSGVLYTYTVEVDRTRPKWSYQCGKSTCWAYGDWSPWRITQVINVDTKYYNLADALIKGGLVIDIADNEFNIQQYSLPQPVIERTFSR